MDWSSLIAAGQRFTSKRRNLSEAAPLSKIKRERSREGARGATKAGLLCSKKNG